MAKIVVTGGAGFVGSHVVEELIGQGGHELHVIDDLSSGTVDNLFPQVTFHKLDIRSEKLPELLLAINPDAIVHTAAQMSVRLSMEDPVFDTDVNVKGLVNILHAFKGKKMPYLAFTSTGGAIYGEQDSFPAPETHPIRPASVYGLAKRVSELYLDLWARVYGLRFAALRLGNVYGPRQNPHGEAGVVAIFCKKILAGQGCTINGSGEQTRDFVYVKDVARAIVLAVSGKVCGTFNIGTGKEASVNELYSMISESLASKAKAAYGPPAAGEQMRSCIDASLALKTFGWKPLVTVKEGIQKTADWFRHAAGKQ